MSTIDQHADSSPTPLRQCVAEVAEALGIADGCPEPTCGNVEPPRSAVTLPSGFMCAYVCTDCGAAWAQDYPTETIRKAI